MMDSDENISQSSNLKILLESAIQELIEAQNQICELQQTLHDSIQPRILNALANLDDVLAIQTIELNAVLHNEFISSYEKVNLFQEENFQEPEKLAPLKSQGKKPVIATISKQEMPSSSSLEESPPLGQAAIIAGLPKEDQKILTIAHYSAYTDKVYKTKNSNSLMVDHSGKYPRLHFLAGSSPDDVYQAFLYGYCGSITSSPGNRELLCLPKVLIESVKKFRRSSRSDMVILKFIIASPEVYPSPQPAWVFAQLCTPNKANIQPKPAKAKTCPEVTPLWICQKRAEGFVSLLNRLQQIREHNQGFMYNAPINIFIYAEGNCTPRFDAINKLSAGISRISSCRVPGSFPMLTHLCGIIHATKTMGCAVCPRRT